MKRWTKYFSAPGAPYDAAKEVVVTPDHKILIAGETGGEVVVGAHKGSRDAFVQSRSLDGDVLWTKQFGSVGSEMVLGLSVSAAGTAYVVGRTSGEFEGFATTRGTSSFLIRIEP